MPERKAPPINPIKKLYECPNCMIKLFTETVPTCQQCGGKMRWKRKVQLG